MQENVQKVIDGELTTDELTAGELQEYRDHISSEAKEEEKKLTGIRSARQDEESKLEEKQKEAEELEKQKQEGGEEEEEGSGEEQQQNQEISQFRQEQVEKAKAKLKQTVEVSDEEMQTIEEKFNRLDSGKMDADYIYEDLLAATAASNPQKYVELTRESEELEKNAAEHNANDAGSSSAPPGESGDENTQYSTEVKEYAEKTGISYDAAQRQLDQGTVRRIE